MMGDWRAGLESRLAAVGLRCREWIPQVLPLTLFVAVLLVYMNSLWGRFVFDDLRAIVQNEQIQRVFPIVLHTRFVADLTFRLNYQSAGLKVADYHVTNLLIHAFASVCLWGVLRRMLAGLGGCGAFAAAMSALVWAVHPLQTESVTYICQRYESLMGLFLLLTVYGFARSVEGGSGRGWRLLSVVCCVLGMGTKEAFVVTPLLVLMYDAVFVARSWRGALSARGAYHAALWLTLGVLGVLWVATMGVTVGRLSYATATVSSLRYAMAQMEIVPHYLRLVFAPWPLCIDYGWRVPEPGALLWVKGLGLAAGLGAGLLLLVRCRPAGFALTAFFLLLAPTSSVFPIADLAAEHRMYMALACVVTLVLTVVARWVWSRFGVCGRGLLAMVMVLVVAGLGLCTVLRNRDYADMDRLWRSVLRSAPDNLRALVGLSAAGLESGRYEDALKYSEAILARLPDYAAQGSVSARDNAITVVERKRRYEQVLYVSALNNAGIALFKLGRNAEAAVRYETALKVFPDDEGVRQNLALVRLALGQ